MPGPSAHRQSPRYPIVLPVLHKRKGSGAGGVGMGWTRNLSEEGACLELRDRLEPSSSLQLLLQTDRGALELTAEVTWTAAGERTGGGLIHGVVFRAVEPAQRQHLRDLLHAKGQVLQDGVRLPIEVPVRCTVTGEGGAALRGWTADMSRAGLLLRLPQIVPPGTAVGVAFPTARQPVAGEGVIVWAESSKKETPGELVRHGFRFTDLGWANELMLALLLAEGSGGRHSATQKVAG